VILLSNALLFDGSGANPYQGDLLIDGNRLAAPNHRSGDEQVVDCTGLAAAPGFLDLHSHSDLQVLDGTKLEKLKQGVTMEVVGNCGFSPFPHGAQGVKELQEFGSGILGRKDGWGWPTGEAYLRAVAESNGPVGVAPLAGHGSLRIAVAGLRQGPIAGRDLDQMCRILDEALAAGCVGFSTGLMYAPGSSAGWEELVALCRVVGRRGKLYATHMRSYAEGLVDAVREQLWLAREAGCRLQISHLQAAGRQNWHLQQQAIDEIDNSGLDVEFDIYPYLCGSTVLTQWLPQWSLDGGASALLKRLRDPVERVQVRDAMPRLQRWSDVTISAVGSNTNQALIGQTVDQIAGQRGASPFDAAIDLLIEEDAAVNVVSLNQSEDNLRQLLTHPRCSVISDGFYVKGRPHPRLHGTFPELLGNIARTKRWMSLAEAIHKVTQKPARRLDLTDRGLLAPGCVADVTLFDPERISSPATYEDPQRDPVGIRAVIRAGRVAFGDL
jgi:N-acyl-D-amino-acid deacylase